MLRELSEVMSVSGGEDAVREFIKNRISACVSGINEDAYGNLIVRKGEVRKPKIMLAAHMDEVGIVITGIEKTGLLRFSAIGISPQVLLAKRVIIGDKAVNGVIGAKPIHQIKKDEKEKVPDIKELFIDVGVSSRKEAEDLIRLGDRGTFDTCFSEYNGIFFGKAFDNRIGCYVLSQLIIHTDFPIYYAFTTQEEAGLRGAQIVGYRVAPEIAIAVDTTASGEWPVESDVADYPEIGKGPVISIADRSVICDRELVSLIENIAQENNIPYQFKKPMVGGTDAGSLHVTREGVRVAVVQTPARYIHSPLSIAAKVDVENEIKLLTRVLERIIKE